MILDLGLMFEYYSFNHTALFTWQCLATVTIAKVWYLSIIHLFKCQELILSLPTFKDSDMQEYIYVWEKTQD